MAGGGRVPAIIADQLDVLFIELFHERDDLLRGADLPGAGRLPAVGEAESCGRLGQSEGDRRAFPHPGSPQGKKGILEIA